MPTDVVTILLVDATVVRTWNTIGTPRTIKLTTLRWVCGWLIGRRLFSLGAHAPPRAGVDVAELLRLQGTLAGGIIVTLPSSSPSVFKI